MDNQFKKTMIRMSFEAAIVQLKAALLNEGFDIGGVTIFHHANDSYGRTVGKYQIFHVYDASLYNDMFRISPVEGIILPCAVSVIETYPGEVTIIPYNATESILRDIQNLSLQNLAAEVTRRLGLVIRGLEKRQAEDPDLVTSWG